MAIDVTQLPGMSGDTGSIVLNAVQTVENGVLCVATASLFNCFQAIISAFELIWDAFQAFFPTRPKVGKDSASDDTALFFIPSANPIIALWGVGIRDLESQGIPTSASGGAGYQANLKLASAVLADLQRQFDGTNAGKVTFGGLPVTGANLFALYHQLGFNANHPDSNATAIHQRTLLDNLYTQLVNQKGIDPKTGFPPPPTKQPTCPPGQHWDGTKCVPDTTKTVLPPGDPENDEFMDCCDETLAAIANLQSAIEGQNAGTTSDCCNQVTSALAGIGTQLSAIAIELQNKTAGGDPLARIIPALDGIGNALTSLVRDAKPPIHIVLDNPPAPATVTVNAPPPDLKPLVDALTKLDDLQDVPQDIINQLVKEGAMSAEMGQLVQGAAVARVRSTSSISAVLNTLDKLNKYFGGGPAPSLPSKESVSSTISKGTTALFEATFKASSAVFSPVINGILTAHNNEIATMKNVAPCQEKAPATKLLTEAIGASIAAHFASVAVESVYPTKNLGFEKISELIAAIAGIEDIIGGLIGVEIQQLVATPHRYCVNEQGRTILPGMGDAASLHARGLITTAQANQLAGYNGLAQQYTQPTLEAAYSGISARQLIRLFATGLFSPADIQDELNFAGMRPASQHRYQLVAPYLATNPERTQLRSQLESEFGAGLMTEGELIAAIDSAEQNTNRDSLILDRVRSKERVEIATQLEKEYTAQYIGSLIDHAMYVQNLTGMGLQQWKVDGLAGIADARKAATLQRQMLAEEKAVTRATQVAERKTSMTAYQDGYTTEPGLLAALLASGLTAQQAAAWVTLANLKKAGSLRWVYGLQLQPAQATLLKERVSALTTQLEKGYINAFTYVAGLDALKLPGHWVNALLAKAEATIAASKGGQKVQLNLT